MSELDATAINAAALRTEHRCPRRGENPLSDRSYPGPDQWDMRGGLVGVQGDNLSCSYCGSLHPNLFMQWVRDDAEVEPSDKNYKAYIECPYPNDRYGETTEEDIDYGSGRTSRCTTVYGRTAKFYFQHLSNEQRQEFVDLLNSAEINIGVPGHFYRLPFFMARPA